MLEQYATIEDMIAALQPEESIYCIRPGILEQRAREFIAAFDGRVLYALKANPMDPVVDALYCGGIRHFDTASIGEIAAISARYDDATTYFMHPVKGWRAMAAAYHQHGVRHFVIDHADELDKVLDVLGDVPEPPVIMVRLATPSKDATFNLSSKFGASPERCAELLRMAQSRGARTGLCFHVGSQCVTTQGHENALELAARVIETAGVAIECLDVGGGFPAPYEGDNPPPLSSYLEVVSRGIAAMNLPAGCTIMCEPGRALVAEGMSMVAQVQLRKDNSLYLNDGVYGTLGGTRLGLHFPTRVIRRNAQDANAHTTKTAFTIYGPTCDGLDVLPYTLDLRSDIAAGDWVEFGTLGAYGPATRTEFNGFKPDQYCYVDAPFTAET